MVSLRGADGAGGSRGMHCWWFAPRFVAALLGDPCPREQPHFPMDAPLPGDQAWHWLQALAPCGSWLLPQHPPSTASWGDAAGEAPLRPSHPTGIQPHPSPWKAPSPPQLQPFVCSLSLTAEWMPESLLSHFLGAVRGCTGGGLSGAIPEGAGSWEASRERSSSSSRAWREPTKQSRASISH